MSSLCCWVWELRLLHVTPPSCDSPCQQTLKNLYDRPQPLLQAEHVIIPRHFHNKVCGWGNKKIWVSGRQNEKIGEGRECHETTTNFSLLLPLCFLLCSVPFSSGHLSFNSLFSLPVICRWTLWTVLAAQRTSSLRRAYRIWETSTTNVRAREGCQSTSVPFVGTAPQVMLACKDGGEGWASIFTLPLTTTTPPTQMRTDSRQRRTCLKSFVKYFVRICAVCFCKYLLSVCCYK